jgi:phage terminase large subunit
MDLERDASTTFERWRDHPEAQVREEFGVEPDAWQLEALQVFPHNNRLALKACKGPGKTAVLAWLILNFLSTRSLAKVGATSITGDNLSTALWPEIALWMGKSRFIDSTFKWTKTRVEHRTHGAKWFAVARTWPKSGNAEQQKDALAGIHGDHCMFVLDESGGIPMAVMVTAEAVLASGFETKVVQAGNPTHTTGPLYVACTSQRHLWYVITITGDPDDPKRSPRIKLDWAQQQIDSYGRDNPWVMVNVLGQFPPSSINALLGVEEVEAAMKRSPRVDAYNWAQKRLGVDVARFGDDRTVIFPRQGLMSWKPVVMRNARTTDIAARVILAERRFGSEVTFIDDTGHWGHGVIDNLIASGRPVIPLNYAGKAIDPRYKNRRVEFWLQGAEAIRNGAALPFIPEMIPELTEPTYTFVGGVFVLEDKDQIKLRLGKSPDLADAYMQTYALEEMPGEVIERVRGRATARRDSDPYAIESPGNADRDGNPY